MCRLFLLFSDVFLRWIIIAVFFLSAILLFLFSSLVLYTQISAPYGLDYDPTQWLYLALMYFTSFSLILFAVGSIRATRNKTPKQPSGLLDDSQITLPNE